MYPEEAFTSVECWGSAGARLNRAPSTEERIVRAKRIIILKMNFRSIIFVHRLKMLEITNQKGEKHENVYSRGTMKLRMKKVVVRA